MIYAQPPLLFPDMPLTCPTADALRLAIDRDRICECLSQAALAEFQRKRIVRDFALEVAPVKALQAGLESAPGAWRAAVRR